MRTLMRRLAATSALLLGLSLTAACGDDTQEPTAGSTGSGAFPVTITHKLGTTTIKSEPKRIVALGEVDQDALLALGVQPVGMVELTGIQPDGLTPWNAPKLSGAEPTLLKSGDSGFKLEEIAALKPDLILAAGDFYIDKYYDKLSQLAPTTAYQTGPAEDTWQQITEQVAKAVGKEDEGRRLIAEVEEKINSTKAKHPELSGKGFAFVVALPSGNLAVMKSPDDISVKLLNQFGMTLPEEIKSLSGENFYAELSNEKLGVLDTDVLIAHYNDNAATQKKFEQDRIFSGLDVVKRGSYVALDLKSFWPLRTPTVLAAPYVVDNVVPQIAQAAAKAG